MPKKIHKKISHKRIRESRKALEEEIRKKKKKPPNETQSTGPRKH